MIHMGAVRNEYKFLGRKTGKQETIWEAYDGRIILHRGSILSDISQTLFPQTVPPDRRKRSASRSSSVPWVGVQAI